jgi:hypothetical protein
MWKACAAAVGGTRYRSTEGSSRVVQYWVASSGPAVGAPTERIGTGMNVPKNGRGAYTQ